MLRIITTLALAALATACATPDEVASWDDESFGTHEAALEEARFADREAADDGETFGEREAATAEEAAPAERAVDDGGDEGGEVQERRVPVRVENHGSTIHVEYNDGSEQDFCLNQETGTYQNCP